MVESEESSESEPRVNVAKISKDVEDRVTKKLAKLLDERLTAFLTNADPKPDAQPAARESRRDDEGSKVSSEGNNDYYSHSSRNHHRRTRRDKGQEKPREKFNNLKVRIPPFYGTNDPDAYLDWEKKIELVFNCQSYTEAEKVNVAATEFYDYAMSWWDQHVTMRKRARDFPIDSWNEMKNLMRKRFVPAFYHRELHARLRNMRQGTKTVEEYAKELETLLLRADIQEGNEAAMSRFMGGLNREIQDRLEVHEYTCIEDMLHKAIMFEQQLRRKKSSYGTTQYSSNRVEKPKEQDKTFTRPRPSTDIKGKGKEETNTRSRDLKCFKCQGYGHYAKECTNKRVIIIRHNGELESEDEASEEELSDECVEEPIKGELLVARRSLSVLSKTEDQEQRENLFHTRCLVKDKVCSLIIDGGSCTNVASETMVNKLGLEVLKHPRPYALQWLNDSGELKVQTQVKVPLSIGSYEDEVLCDILPMEASHILLGRPWQSDRQAIHDGFCNRHSFVHKGRKIVLTPLTPTEVYQDQLRLKEQREGF